MAMADAVDYHLVEDTSIDHQHHHHHNHHHNNIHSNNNNNNNDDVSLKKTYMSQKKAKVDLTFENLTYTVNTFDKFKKGKCRLVDLPKNITTICTTISSEYYENSIYKLRG